jgi:tellurite resistance protein TerC
MHSIGSQGLWIGFFVFVLVVIAIDFLMGGRKAHRISTREAMGWTFIWISCAFIFNFILWWYLTQSHGKVIADQKAIEFFTGYLIEESLSMDNLFIFLLIFSYFSVPLECQRRVLLYGVLGAIIMRMVMILFGIWLVVKLHWILYIFGLFLLMTGVKMLLMREGEKDLSKNFLVVKLQRYLPVTPKFHGELFFIREQGKWHVTPLFLALILIEISDLIFALDSIPAIFAVTQDPFIVFTSNIFAILGLRALFFLLSGMASRFYLLKYGIAFMLTFIGLKMLIMPWVKIPVSVTLGVVAAILTTSILLSLRFSLKRKDKG